MESELPAPIRNSARIRHGQNSKGETKHTGGVHAHNKDEVRESQKKDERSDKTEARHRKKETLTPRYENETKTSRTTTSQP